MEAGKTALERYHARVEELLAQGMTRDAATVQIARQETKLHCDMLAEVNDPESAAAWEALCRKKERR